MRIDDPLLPAAAHLTGPRSIDLLRSAVAAVDGSLTESRPCQVRYRPGSDLVVRYSARVRWNGGPPTDETLMAATTAYGPKPDTLLATADHDGRALEASVWRWPFDPDLPGLVTATNRSSAAKWLGDLVVEPIAITVRAFRPTERAVVHVRSADGVDTYLKVVPPATTLAVADHHRRIAEAGVRVPRVLRCDAEQGLIAMEALTAPTLRELIKSATPRWPDADEFLHLTARLATIDVDGLTTGAGRAEGAVHHARMLSAVLPTETARIERFIEPLERLASRSASRTRTPIHGDLYDGQVTVQGGRIDAVLDLDDVRLGDRYDDLATLLGHLFARTLTDAPGGGEICAYAERLRHGFGCVVDLAELDAMTAAVLVGVATGPFRVHQRAWKRATRRHLALATRLLAGAGDNDLSFAS